MTGAVQKFPLPPGEGIIERIPAAAAKDACIGAGYLLAWNCVASVAEWSRRLSVAQEITGSNPVARPNTMALNIQGQHYSLCQRL